MPQGPAFPDAAVRETDQYHFARRSASPTRGTSAEGRFCGDPLQIVGAEVAFEVSQGLHADAISPGCGTNSWQAALWNRPFWGQRVVMTRMYTAFLRMDANVVDQ